MLLMGRKSKLTVLMIIYCVLIEWIYFNIISRVYAYTNIAVNFDFDKQILLITYLIPFSWIAASVNGNNILFFLNTTMLVFSALPTFSLWPIDPYATYESILYTAAYWSIFELCILGVNALSDKRIASSKQFEVPYSRFLPVIMAIILLYSIYMAFRYGDGFRLLAFDESLDVRLSLREVHIPAFLRYPFYMLGGLFLPLLTSYGLKSGKAFIYSTSLLSSVLLYSVNGMKSWVLFQILAIALHFLIDNDKHQPIDVSYFILIGAVCICIVAMVMYYMFNSIYIISYLHRLFTVYPETTYYTIDFFKNGELIMLRDTILSRFVSSPYPFPYGRMIGLQYYGNSDLNASNGMVADAFANFGLLGISLYPILVSGILAYLSKRLRCYAKEYTYLCIILVGYLFIGNSYTTCLITGGLIPLILLINIIDNTVRKRKKAIKHESSVKV